MSNSLWNGVSNVSETELEVSVDSSSDFPHIHVVASLLRLTVILLEIVLLLLVRVILVLHVVNLLIFTWDDVSSRILIIFIVSEEVVQFRVNYSFNNASSMVSLLL